MKFSSENTEESLRRRLAKGDLKTEFFLGSFTYTKKLVFFDSVMKQAKFLQENFLCVHVIYQLSKLQRESAALELPEMR